MKKKQILYISSIIIIASQVFTQQVQKKAKKYKKMLIGAGIGVHTCFQRLSMPLCEELGFCFLSNPTHL